VTCNRKTGGAFFTGKTVKNGNKRPKTAFFALQMFDAVKGMV
jgi:hypothetical protein